LNIEDPELLGYGLVEMPLVANFLVGLVGPKAECTTCAFHDDIGAETAEHAGLVVLAWIELGDDSIVEFG
jgi:hypothetical protein